MILRGIQLQHWRCIEHLELTELPAGIVVLHGPNRTGKSSLVRALRCCLFDYDHNTTSKEFKKNIPWGTPHSPRVAIAFDLGQESYRITKVFSPRHDGLAHLERKVGEHWRTEEDSPREASRKVRELLGMDKQDSTAGLNQLLWLDQGTVKLPEPEELDGSLEKQLMSVLGVVVTGSDLAFKKKLDERWAEWFTPGGRIKEASVITRLEREREQRLQILDEEERKYREIEQVVRELERCEDEQPELVRAVQHARAEAVALREECEHSHRRRAEYQQAERVHEAARKQVHEAEQRLVALAEVQCRCADELRRAEEAEHTRQVALQERNLRAGEYIACQEAVRGARQAAEAHERGRDAIADHRRLLELAQQRGRLAEQRQGVERLEKEIADLEKRLRDNPAPEAKLLDELRRNRRKAADLRAELRAAALTLTIALDTPATLGLRIDDQEPESETLQAKTRTWQLRQRATVELQGIGRIEVARSTENVDLERSAQTLRELDRRHAEAVRAYQDDPTDEACLDRLGERRLKRQGWLDRLAQVRQDLTRLAPHGSTALDAEQQELDGLRQAVLVGRPDLAEWQPKPEAVTDLERAFSSHAERLKRECQETEAREKEAQKQLQKAEKRLAAASEQRASARATAQAAQEEQQRLGDETALRAAVQQSVAAAEAAAQRFAEATLTDAEKTVEQRLSDGENALRQRADRLRKLEDELNRLRGRLEGSEGLHIRRADAETALREIDRQLERARLEADAHNRLRTLFEHCKESQVQQVLGPISDRVHDWARRLGLDDYRTIRFGDRFLPDGFVPQRGATEMPMLFEEESYGTDEQLGLLVRLALGGVLAHEEPALVILDDPLAHADPVKHRRILEVLKLAACGNASLNPPAGRLQIVVLTCHPERFDHLAEAHHVDLTRSIRRGT